jgi:hypothetical protein
MNAGTKAPVDPLELLTEQLQTVHQAIEAIDTSIEECPPKIIDQRLRLRELQILYHSLAISITSGIEMFR